MYVTFNVRNLPCFGGKIERYAIKCKDMEQAKLIASDINSFDGVSYLRISTKSKPHKEAHIFDGDRYFEAGYFKF